MIYKTRGRGGGLFFRAQRRRDDGRRGISMREFYATLAVVQKSVHVCVCVCVCRNLRSFINFNRSARERGDEVEL